MAGIVNSLTSNMAVLNRARGYYSKTADILLSILFVFMLIITITVSSMLIASENDVNSLVKKVPAGGK